MTASPRVWVAAFTLHAFLILTLRPAPATAQESDVATTARAHYEAGQAAYAARDYAAAIRSFQAAQAILPAPVLDYHLGLAFDGAGDAVTAVSHYRGYLAAQPDPPERAEVEARIVVLERNLIPPPAGEQSSARPVIPPLGPGEDGPQRQAPPPQYQGPPPQYRGPPPYAYRPFQAPKPLRRKRRWWIVFPVLGGIAGAACIGLLVWAAATDRLGGSGDNDFDLTVGPPRPAPPSDSGALFRF